MQYMNSPFRYAYAFHPDLRYASAHSEEQETCLMFKRYFKSELLYFRTYSGLSGSRSDKYFLLACSLPYSGLRLSSPYIDSDLQLVYKPLYSVLDPQSEYRLDLALLRLTLELIVT